MNSRCNPKWSCSPSDAVSIPAAKQLAKAGLVQLQCSRKEAGGSAGPLALPAPCSSPSSANVVTSTCGRLTRRKTAHVAPFVFTGVQIMTPALLRDPPGDVFSTNIFWDRAIEAGRLYGVSHQGLWFDVGTPKAIPVVESMITHG